MSKSLTKILGCIATQSTAAAHHVYHSLWKLFQFRYLLGMLLVVCSAHFHLRYAGDLAVTLSLTVNATVTNQWRNCTWAFPLRPPSNAEHEAALVASTVCQVFGLSQTGIESIIPTLVPHTQPGLRSRR